MKIIIIANGSPPSRELFSAELDSVPCDQLKIICADGGANALFKYNQQLLPSHIIGDLDSIEPQTLDFFQKKGANITRFPKDKAETDTELALRQAILSKPKEIILLGATGNRLDHFLGNIALLLKAAQQNIAVTMKDDSHSLEIISKAKKISGQRGEIFSLQAYGEMVKKLSLKGSKYELSNYDLLPGDVLTLSNEFLDQTVNITFAGGYLLLMRVNPK